MNDHQQLRPLAELGDYELKNERQDIRCEAVVGPSGRSVGRVDELLVDKDHERVAAVRLDDGAVIPVENLERRGDTVLLRAAASGPRNQDEAEEKRIPVVQEEMLIGKRDVERGGVRVQSRIVEEPIREDLALREEHVSVARRPVADGDRAVDASAFKERTIAMTQRAEEALVTKDARVVEEVVVRKEVDQRVERIEDSIRHTEVDVQDDRTSGPAAPR